MTNTIQYLTTLAFNLMQKRIKIKNENNGYAYMSCVVVNKKNPYYVLRKWLQQV